MKNTTILSLAISLLIISCSPGSGKKKSEANPANTPAISAPSPTSPSTNTTPPTTVVNNPVSGKGLNPAHGEPGHRCDISVGAPLNSAPANAPTPTTTVTPPAPVMPTTTTPKTSAPPTTTAVGMNPAHGQPGHRCEIAVGAPLNNKPTTPAVNNFPVTPVKQ